jgi:hypothetical protein
MILYFGKFGQVLSTWKGSHSDSWNGEDADFKRLFSFYLGINCEKIENFRKINNCIKYELNALY